VDGKDHFKWPLMKNGLFTTLLMYLDALDTHPPFQHRKIWKWKLPLKIKFFSLVSSEGHCLDKRQPCEEKLERELEVCLLQFERNYSSPLYRLPLSKYDLEVYFSMQLI
jgi:hypothetical protein